MLNLKKTLLFSLILLLLSHILLYTTYKRYDITRFPKHDAFVYMNLVKNPHYSASYGYNYRLFTPFLVRAAQFLPLYDTGINANFNAEDKKIYWIFCVVNYLAVWLTACLLFFYYTRCYKINDLFSFLGSLFYLLSYTTLQSNLLVRPDAIAHLCIVILLILVHCKHYFVFSAFLLLNIFNKEIVPIFFFLYFSVSYLFNRHLNTLKLGIFSLLCFILFLFISMSTDYVDQYGILTYSDYLTRLIDIKRIFTHSLQTFGGYLPLGVSIVIYGFFKLTKTQINIVEKKFLLIYMGLLAVAIMGNSGDPVIVLANGLPLYILFQIQVFQHLYRRITN